MSTNHNFSREKRAEPESNRGPSAYQLNALPLGQTGSPKTGFDDVGLDALMLGTATGFPRASSFKRNYRGKLSGEHVPQTHSGNASSRDREQVQTMRHDD